METLTLVNDMSVRKNMAAHKMLGQPSRCTWAEGLRGPVSRPTINPLPQPPLYRRSSDTGGCHFMNTSLSPRGSCSLITRKIPQECFSSTLALMVYRILHLAKRWPSRGNSEISECHSCVFFYVLLEKWRCVIVHYTYRGADKSLARPGRKQATATEDFDFHISYS